MKITTMPSGNAKLDFLTRTAASSRAKLAIRGVLPAPVCYNVCYIGE